MNNPLQPDIEGKGDGKQKKQALSMVWLVPLFAFLITVGVAWQQLASRGPLIEIEFEDAKGIEAGTTVIKYKDMEIGQILEIKFNDDYSKVIATARMNKQVAKNLNESTVFWLVEAEISPQGVTGLDTLLSGAYIGASWDVKSTSDAVRSFAALKKPPLTGDEVPGTRVRLRGPDGGSLNVGASVRYKKINVGKVESKFLSVTGDAVYFDLFIDAPYDQYLTTGSRFWNTSGIYFSIGTTGPEVHLDSLASLIQGGVSFDVITSGAEPVGEGHTFELFATETLARGSIYTDSAVGKLDFTSIFMHSIKGLSVGAPVEIQGIRVGEVKDITAKVIEIDGKPKAALYVHYTIDPSRYGINVDMPETPIEILQREVNNGMRAQLATSNILTGSLYLNLFDDPNAQTGEIDMTGDPFPIIPVSESSGSGFADAAEGVFARVNNLPVEELMDSAIRLLNNANEVVASQGTRAIPQNVNKLIDDIIALVNQKGLQDAPDNLDAALVQIRQLTQTLNDRKAAENLADALGAAKEAATNVSAASEALPDVAAKFGSLAEKASELPLDQLVNETTRVVKTLEGILAEDSVKDIPPALSSSLTSLSAILDELREGGAVTNVNTALGSIDDAARSISIGAQDLPQLIKQIGIVAADISNAAKSADNTLALYGNGTKMTREIEAAIREIEASAKSINSLAREIERNPNSLLFGR